MDDCCWMLCNLMQDNKKGARDKFELAKALYHDFLEYHVTCIINKYLCHI